MENRFPLFLTAAAMIAFGATWYLTDASVPAGPEDRDAWMRQPGAPSATKSSEFTYFETCEQVRAAGRAPLMAGRPGYNPKLDPDGTGVACPPL